ncbi:unnamed protein product [Prorocentrum cordatum]|uniref:Uncharacterized protein n=1 Tax=Prorocentrum cordatum TaxID=2364126 RepID=A0ABN9TTF6_9DINO|nr:unnamed protein product [Polarella glacialis]
MRPRKGARDNIGGRASRPRGAARGRWRRRVPRRAAEALGCRLHRARRGCAGGRALRQDRFACGPLLSPFPRTSRWLESMAALPFHGGVRCALSALGELDLGDSGKKQTLSKLACATEAGLAGIAEAQAASEAGR